MKKWKPGDRVRIVEREQTPKDIKDQTYYPHFGGLTGSVVKTYDFDEVCVEVDRDGLPSNLSKRHGDIEKRLKDKLMDSLSQDARSRLSEAERRFVLSYTVLVGAEDLEPFKGPKPQPKPAEPQIEDRPKEKDLEAAEEEFMRQLSGS